MSKLPRLSGLEIIKILTREYGFSISKRSGSHVSLVKFIDGRKVVTIVPVHKEVKMGTLLGILDLAEITRDDFMSKIG